MRGPEKLYTHLPYKRRADDVQMTKQLAFSLIGFYAVCNRFALMIEASRFVCSMYSTTMSTVAGIDSLDPPSLTQPGTVGEPPSARDEPQPPR
jgi:hypothetical protein